MNCWILSESVIFNSSQQFLESMDCSKKIFLSIREVLLLGALLEGETDKRALIEIVWPNIIVSDGSYHKLLFELRANLQAMGLPSAAIKTIPRRGCIINIPAVIVNEADLKNQSVCESSSKSIQMNTSQVAIDFVKDNDSVLDRGESIAHTVPDLEAQLQTVTVKHTENKVAKFVGRNSKSIFVTFCFFLLFLFLFILRFLQPFDNISAYIEKNESIEMKLYSISNASTLWDFNAIDSKQFSYGFHYTYGDRSSYFLCDKEAQCVNYILLLR